MSRKNLDVYVTGSNSKMLSSDIATYFRDRGSEIRIYPLSFAEKSTMPMSEIESILEKYRPGINSAEVYNCASVFSFLAEKLNGMISSRMIQ